MQKSGVLLLALLLFVAVPLQAQEGHGPPKPLDDDFCEWMIGEWEGTGESPMGKTHEWQKVEWALDQQFVMTTFKSKLTQANPEALKAWGEAMGMSAEEMDKMKDMIYRGIGPMTIDPKTGEFVGYWFDNWRGTYKGVGKREGNKVVMTWKGTMGTSIRTIEKVGPDKMVFTYKEEMPGGQTIEGRSELTRRKVTKKY